MSEMVLYQPGGGTSSLATTPAAPAQQFPTRLPGQPGGSSNWGAVAFLTLLALAILTLWRIRTNRITKTKAKTVWSAVVLALVISLATDLNRGLGAAFGFAVVLFILLKETGFTAAAGAALKSPGSNAAAPARPNPGTTATTGACPPGQLPTRDTSGNLVCFTPNPTPTVN